MHTEPAPESASASGGKNNRCDTPQPEHLQGRVNTEELDPQGAALKEATIPAPEESEVINSHAVEQLHAELRLLKNVPFLKKLDDVSIEKLRSIMEPCAFESEQIIGTLLSEAKSFHIIINGKVEFISLDSEGKEMIVGEAGVGDFFGEMPLLGAEGGAVTIRAKENVSTLALDQNEFNTFLDNHPEAARSILSVLVQRLAHNDKLLRESVSKNVNKEHDDKLSVGQKVADRFASVIGSWRFIIVQSALLATWVTLNAAGVIRPWDPYPFILLNLALSFQAAYAGPIIMMSQNRQAARDRIAADVDHQVNLNAEKGIRELSKRLERLEQQIGKLTDPTQKKKQ